ncbi:uncharacterized protein [Choristoneura fumiferana]|uniref:uncharacterized protein n=1 Tax=Choristoneura fumiferana TaxID=7141 RepID=UPI003D15360F
MTAEPSTSAPVDNSNNSALAAEPSISAPVVNYNNSAVVAAEPSTSVAVDEATVLTTELKASDTGNCSSTLKCINSTTMCDRFEEEDSALLTALEKVKDEFDEITEFLDMEFSGDLFNNDKFRRSLNEKHQRNNSCVSSSDFYGCNYPVDKHRFSSGDLIRPLVAKELNFNIDKQNQDNLYNSIDPPEINPNANSERATESPSRNVEEMYAKVMKKAKAKNDEVTRKIKDESEPHTSKYRADDPGYETIDRKKSNHGYETIANKERKISQNQDPGYETVKDINKPNPNFSNNNLLKLNHVDSGPNSIISSDAGYEHISKVDNSASDSDPNYEVLRNQPPTPPYATIAPNFKVQPTYSTVNKRPSKYNDWPNNNGDLSESNYESMPHDPLYKGSGSESDPNYESVRPKDPNYECVNAHDPNYESLRLKDPKYESVRSKASKSDSMRSRKDPNYESVKYFELSKKEPPYEKLNNETAGSSVERSDSAAGYEKINVPNNREEKRSINNGAEGVVSDYFQV